MDLTGGSNDLGDYFQFLPEDTFNLFGDYDLHLNFTQFLGPESEAVNNTFEAVESELQEDAAPDVNITASTSSQLRSIITSSEITLPGLQHSSACTGEPINSHTSNEKMTSHTAEGADQNDSNATVTKRKFLAAFSATSGEEVPLHTRKPFSQQRRQAVALHRAMGICIQCKLRKVACDSGLPCEKCVKRAGSTSSGQEICMRKSLVATRFDQIDLISLVSKKSFVKSLHLPTELHIDDWAYIWFPGKSMGEVPETSIKIPIVLLEIPDFQPTRQFVLINYYSSYVYNTSDSQYAIAPSSLPSLESLVRAYLANRRDYYANLGPFAGLHKAIRDFVEAYCMLPGPMPLKGLLSKILQLQRFLDIYRISPLMKKSHENSQTEAISSRMLVQLRVQVGEAIIRVEADVLTQIDKLTQSKEGIGRQNPLAVWACLWILILSYKEHMVYLKVVTSFDSNKAYNLNQHIYNMLTSIYAALYKTTSPLTLDWRSKEVADMMWNDVHLIKLFCNIKTEMFWFQADRNLLCPEDTLFRTLVVDNESKLVMAHIKAAKRQGIL